MSVELKIPMEALNDGRVAECLASLVRALCDAQSGKRREARPSEPTMSWDAFVKTLTPATQDFIKMLKKSGKVTMTDAVKALKMSQNKAMGGLTGALSRKAARNGISLPFRQVSGRKGERAWTWTGDGAAGGGGAEA